MKAIDRIMKALSDKGLKPSRVEKLLGFSNGYLATMQRRKADIGEQNLLKLSEYLNFSLSYLVSGEENNSELSKEGVSLITHEAAAGFGTAVFAIKEEDVMARYVVPDFTDIDFMIRVKGSSMYPKYSSGDIVACRVLRERTFIQWNKPYIIATREQGLLCKRLLQSKKKGSILAVSDNKDYPPFDIPEEDITGIALIVGTIRLE